ncbi:MAG: hypothetical protein JO121_19505 [Deltaproteobacteria bacterium]|nr:hypothetical protein [Deltaproteobacteria bacterium]
MVAREILNDAPKPEPQEFLDVERRMKFADLEREWAQVLRGLEALQQVEATFEQKRFLLRSQLTAEEASAALRAAGVAAPPTLRELP